MLVLIVAGGFALFKQEREDEAIKIGVIIPLTGSLAKVGEDVRAALQIAEALLDSQDAIELIFEDDAFLPEKSVSAFQKLTSVDGVDAVIGPLNGSAIEAVRPLALEKKIVAFTPWGAGNRIGGYTIKNSVEADEEAHAIAELATSQFQLKRLAILYLKNEWGLTHARAFETALKTENVELIASEPFDFGTTDYRTQLTKIKAARPDGLFIVNNGAAVGIVAKQARQLGIAAQLFGQYATESSDLIASGGMDLEGLIYSFPIDESNLSDTQKQFVADFEAKAGGKPQVAAYNAYDIYAILRSVFKKCGRNNSLCVRDYILGLKEYVGLGGIISFAEQKLHREFHFKTIREGQFMPLAE
ncbi:MAG: ABC-type branched-chain amino acid transport system, periplasmic component [Parcubacteria group bacterium GW2011_GWA2_47_64]|nr:MAG: ABC-type branched-chain amino acid transport system, periplasmic component [Parcubacteria group bacterium GW2011_GWA2_47_64]